MRRVDPLAGAVALSAGHWKRQIHAIRRVGVRSTSTRKVRTAVRVWILLLVTLCCGANPSPRRVVELYFLHLVQDPIGTLPLLSQEFHARHGLRALTLARYKFVRDARETKDSPGAPQPIETPGELSRAVYGWLVYQYHEPAWPYGIHIPAEVLEERVDGDRAVVTTRVRMAPMPPFLQRFVLSRSGVDAPWLIDEIEQEEVSDQNVRGAFIAAPNGALLAQYLAIIVRQAKEAPGSSASSAAADSNPLTPRRGP